MLTSIDRDGTRGGFDCELTLTLVKAINIPVIAWEAPAQRNISSKFSATGMPMPHWPASIFHLGIVPIGDLKQNLLAAEFHEVPC